MKKEYNCKCYGFKDLEKANEEDGVREFYLELAKYRDPDSMKSEGKGAVVLNEAYYRDICEFLNFRESELDIIPKDGRYEYKQGKGGSIEVKINDEHQFYLKSDQFGFRIPSQNGGIYDRFLEYCQNDTAISFVRECIRDTRSIGGSFLWALEEDNGRINLNPCINLTRAAPSHQQDRVDLTLWLLKSNYDKSLDSLNKCNIKKWLDHFKNFNNYITYFMFDDFVTNYGIPWRIPWSIVKSDFKNGKKICIKEPNDERTKFNDLNSADDIKRVLMNVRLLALKRSYRIECYVKKCKIEQLTS